MNHFLKTHTVLGKHEVYDIVQPSSYAKQNISGDTKNKNLN